MPFSKHRSKKLNALFKEQPYQGADPKEAHFLFVGLDANYDEHIEASSIFPQMIDYLKDGVSFWKRHEVHHPFLLRGYRGCGRKFHQTFSRIGFGLDYADKVSFVETFHLPTIGQNNLKVTDLDRAHLLKLDEWIREGKSEHIFITASAARLLKSKALEVFTWLPKIPSPISAKNLTTWYEFKQKKVYLHYHFSAYGRYNPKNHINEIGRLLN